MIKYIYFISSIVWLIISLKNHINLFLNKLSLDFMEENRSLILNFDMQCKL